MTKLINWLKSLPKYFYVFAIITIVTQILCYYLPLLLAPKQLTVLSSDLDNKIPVISAFIYVYVLAFVFWVYGYGRVYLMNKPVAYRLLTADLICKIVCAVVFCVYPCTMVQPDINELSGVGAWLHKIIYAADTPTRLMPSMHCYISILLPIAMFSKYAGKMPFWAKACSLIFGVLVCLSTLFVKQHVLVDVYTGAALAIVSWALALIIWKIIDKRRLGIANNQNK